MESLPKNRILEFNHDVMAVLRGRYNLDKPGDMDKAINILQDWLNQQDHIANKTLAREYLERIIITQKGSIGRAKVAIDKMCTVRTLLPKFFENNNIRNISKNHEGILMQIFLPKQTKEHYRIFIPQVINNGLTSDILFAGMQSSVLFCDYMKAVDYNDGVILISDFTKIDIVSGMKAINVIEIRQVLTVFLEGFSVRVKAVHLISPSTAIDLLATFLKSLLKKKVADRFHVHKSMEELHQFVPKELLPADFGGDQKPLKEFFTDWIDLLSSEKTRALIEDIRNNKTDEKYRDAVQFNEQYMGMAGSFRTFTVD
ncbi:hypothetical protein K1T71_011306 [Dendrolimus kikuchii]|uniref:Uncharacterized protein n=1 Tax=Dendrolimus kikuchii TaxID=765133 RepID=A0ACC1CNI1_9NEOP|nr:hypothetical protein K1T71_011306 [Dendrolimus kikuchii]